MKAILFDDFGDAEVLHIGEAATPELRPTDLLIRVRAAGVNRADITHRRGGYGRADFGESNLMGLEIAGEVIEVGSATAGFKIGERVMGVVGGGAYAEIARIDYRMAMPIPSDLDFVGGAAIPEAFITAHEALIHLACLQPGETVLIHAASGGVGSAAVQLAHAQGARIIATCDARRLDQVRELGADTIVDYRTQDFCEAVASGTAGRGVDVIIDFIGAPYLARNIRSLAEGGRLVQVGIMGGSADAILPLDLLLYRRLRIIGTVMKSRSTEAKHAMTARFRDRWLADFASGRLRPIIDSTFPLAQAADAQRRMEQGGSVGKIVLTVP